MKKLFLFFLSAVLLLSSCAREVFGGLPDGELTNVSFTANLNSGVATRAFADGDGNGAKVNRCIMEIYYNNTLYRRLVEDVTPANGVNKAFATFSNVPVVAGKEYQILFWADCENGQGDKYYTTADLKTVTVNKEAFVAALTNGKNDELDAFFCAKNYTVHQTGGNYDANLTRPFAQLNIITTDVGENKTVNSPALLPDKVSVKYTAGTVFNVATGEVSDPVEFSYTAEVYGNWATITTEHKELTLSMDYLLASADKGAIDVKFETSNGSEVMSHKLTNLPYQRNYRTNVKGELLTVNGTWKATIDPIWNQPDIVKVVEVADIKSANEIINQYAAGTDILEVKFKAEPNDSGVPTGSTDSPSRAIRTTPIKENGNLNIEVLAQTNELYVGDYTNEYNIESVDTENAKHAVVNINIPETSSIRKLVINAPTKSVYINGKQVDNVGSIDDLDAITSQNTLIIEKEQTVNKLTIRQGGLEIHGTVSKAIVPEGHGQIQVRDCENLDETKVYDVLKPHIAEGYVGVKDRTTAGKWDIVPVICKINDTYYGSLADAVADVQDNVETTITMVANHEILGNAGVTIPATKNVILDLAGYTVKNLVNENKSSQVIMNKGKLKITDNVGTGLLTNSAAEGTQTGEWWSTPQYNYATNVITNNGDLTIDGANLLETATSSICYAIDNKSNGVDATCTIKSGNINTLASTAIRMFCNSTTKTNTMNVLGGLIEGGYTGIWLQLPGNGQEKKKAKLNISGGTLKGGTYAWYDYTYGDLFDEVKVTISGGLLDGEIFSYGTNIDISGGVFTSDVNIKQTKPSTISVTGGRFSGDVYAYGDSATEKFISGGVFEAEPDAQFVLDGYAVVANTDATTKAQYPWAVEALGQAKIGNVVYPTLEAAVAAAVEAGSGTIELLPAYIESGRYPQTWVHNWTDTEIYEYNPEYSGHAAIYTFASLAPDSDDTIDIVKEKAADYLNWDSDYEVSFDENIDYGDVILAGQYGSFGEIHLPERAMQKEEIWTLLSRCFNYQYMLEFVQNFHCGVYNANPSANAGKTMRVDLCMYHPDNKNIKILVKRTEYTFPQVSE